ncbi:MAG: pentapeptide repeat-containing protein [Paludibacteraceae bacterium]|nr:pentapeptide repeat-containing protein [Paludibacteraceae bacterium]
MNENWILMKEYWAVLGIVVVVIGTVIREYIKWKGAKSDETLRYEYQKSFDKIISDLSSENTSLQLTAAILLRRFFMINEMKKCGDFLKDETIHVISSLLRTLPSSVFQKTVGDGLAYAKDLSGVDLQRTNLQDVCLEGKSSRLILNNCDLFMADLSYALVKNVNAEGAYFYHSILLKTRFKNCNLRGADFRNADLTKTCFENVDLFTAKFDGAINIPEEISAGLDNYIDKDGNVYKAYMKEQKVTIRQNNSLCNIFFSIPGCASAEDNALISEYRKVLEHMNYNVICYTRDQYPQFGQLNKIRKDILQSAAMLVFGFKQIRIDKAVFRPNTKEEEVWEKKWLPTPWNEIEVGLGAMLGLPILLVKDNDVHSGIFDNHLSESFIAIVSANDKIDDVLKGRSFNLWLSKFKNTDVRNAVIKEDFVNYYAKEQHEIWCKERISQGWTYGETRNDELKQHPCLVEYELLPDSEKEYNRKAAIATYNAINNSGFKIYKK